MKICVWLLPGEDFWEYLGKLRGQGWVIAQHGQYHRYTTQKGMLSLNRFSEYAGVPYENRKA